MSDEAIVQSEEQPESEAKIATPAKRNNEDEDNLSIPTGKKSSAEVVTEGAQRKDFTSDSKNRRLANFIAKVLEECKELSVEEQIATLVQSVESTKEEAANRELIIQSLEKWISPSYPDIRILCFGSAASGLTTHNSDLDVFLDLPDSQNGVIEEWDALRARKFEILEKVSQLLTETQPDIQPFKLVSKARIPVFKFRHLPTGINCDLSCTSSIGVHNSNLLRSIVESDTRIRSFFFLIKLWSKCQRFSYLTSYALCLLVIYYLQKREDGILPSIESLKTGIPPLLVDGWNAAFRPPVVRCDPALSVMDLLSGFLAFYRDYDDLERVISPLIGDTLSRDEFEGDGTATLPESMDLYVRHCIRENNKRPFRFHHSIAVQDAFELNHNTTLTFSRWEKFREACSTTLEKISSGGFHEIFHMEEPIQVSPQQEGKKPLTEEQIAKRAAKNKLRKMRKRARETSVDVER